MGSQADGAAGTKPAARLDFEEIVRKHGRRLFLLAFRLTGDRADAEDLSQETLVRGYIASTRFEGRADFYTYLHRALLNLWKNHLRRRRRWRMVPLFGSRSAEAGVERGAPGSDGGGPAGRLADPSPGPHERLVRHQHAEKLQRALMRLHPDFRAVLVLRVGEGLEYEEIAASLGIPIGTVRSRLARARERVRALMER
ncbi:MAG TPA: sigma-70 family RNA polymerase sigma factor [Candidatus Polarisedimenticolia bacterium]|nr:sigma-70 family RNA polymerase sigma factor [Candidatus Polarisedimenticolia bacterium]